MSLFDTESGARLITDTVREAVTDALNGHWQPEWMVPSAERIAADAVAGYEEHLGTPMSDAEVLLAVWVAAYSSTRAAGTR